MIKGISSINNIAKAGVVTALLMGAAAMNATNPIKSANQNQTEVVSKEGAQALKAMNVQNDPVHQTSSLRNQRIENLLKKVVHTPEDEKEVGEIIDYVNESGLYNATALMQHEIDCQMLDLFLKGMPDILINKNINPKLGKKIKDFGPEFFMTANRAKDALSKWAEEDYSPVLQALLKLDSKKPTYREVDMKINEIVEKKLGLNNDEIYNFYITVNQFRQETVNKQRNDISVSELIAYKIFLIDYHYFEKSLYNQKVFGIDSFVKDKESVRTCFKEWMDSVNPEKLYKLPTTKH